ncbi:hypothetical protein PFISCL1PPCAC_7372, partial [Pristionchus fissidentatus]
TALLFLSLMVLAQSADFNYTRKYLSTAQVTEMRRCFDITMQLLSIMTNQTSKNPRKMQECTSNLLKLVMLSGEGGEIKRLFN